MGLIAGSHREPLGRPVAEVPDHEPIDVTIVLAPAGPGRFHADLDDIAAVRQFAADAHLDVLSADPETRTVLLRGPAAHLQAVFDTTLAMYDVDGHTIRAREGTLAIPDHLDDAVVAVLGLDERPVARPRFRPAAGSAPASLTAVEVAKAYDFPAATGAGQTVAIIELGGGFGASDLASYFKGLGLATPTVTAVPVGGGKNVAGQDPNGADGEVLLDIEVAGAVAPGARQLVYFAPNTDAGFLAAINAAAAASPGPAAISISWGGPESSWTAQSMTAFDHAFAAAAAAGIVVLAAAGDAGAKDGTSKLAADFPASSPNVIACGGTRLTVDSAGRWATESVWDDGASSATGGGYSKTFPRPAWQPTSVGAHRGLPDMSGNADPESGYEVVIDGEQAVVGGTSAVAPLLAGLVARLVQLTEKRLGASFPAVAYANAGAFVDITSGGNEGYKASAGWDPASGLGSPDGSKLLAAIGGSSPTPPPTGPTPPVSDPNATFAAALDQFDQAAATWRTATGQTGS